MDYRTYVYLHGGINTSIEGIYLTKPVDPVDIKKYVPNLKGIVLEFDKTSFQPQAVNHFEYLQSLLQTFSFEEIRIQGSKRLDALPEEIGQPSLQKLEITRSTAISQLPDSLKKAKKLSHLSIHTDTFTIPTFLSDFQKLKTFKLSAKKVYGWNNLQKVKSLNELGISDEAMVSLDFNFKAYKKLEKLVIQSAVALQTLPSFKPLRNLKVLSLYNLPALKVFPDGWDSLQKLEDLSIAAVGTQHNFINWPQYKKLPSLQKLRVEGVPLTEFMSNLGEMPQCQSLVISHVKISSFPKSFRCTRLQHVALRNLPALTEFPDYLLQPGLKHLTIESIGARNIDADFAACLQLERVFVKNVKIEALPPSLFSLQHLQSFQLEDCSALVKLPDFNEGNSGLKEIKLNHLPALQILSESWGKIPSLERIEIADANIQKIPGLWAESNSIRIINLFNNPQLQYIPSVLGKLPLIRLSIRNCPAFDEKNEKLLQETLRYIDKNQPDLHEREAIFFLLFNNERHEEITPALKKTIFHLLSIPNPGIRQLVFDKLYLFNPGMKKGIESLAQPNATLTILGKTKSTQTTLRNRLKEVNIEYHNHLKPSTNFVVLGTKPPLPESLWDGNHIFLSEAELEQWLAEKKPEFLQQVDTDTLLNLRRLIWSNEPANDALVWEMVKNGGMPDALAPDLVVVAKTSQNHQVRQALRKFLKGKLTLQGQQILSDRTNLMLSRCPYEQYLTIAPDFDVAQLALTHARRSGHFIYDFFRLPSIENPYRAELFEEVKPRYLDRDHYLALQGLQVTTQELNSILEEPVFAGNLKRVVINSHHLHEFPRSLLLHQSLKDVTFEACHLSFDQIPPAFWELKRLSKLRLRIATDDSTALPNDFGKLTKLSEVLIYNENPIRLPESIKCLTKLKRFYCSGGISNYQEYKSYLPK